MMSMGVGNMGLNEKGGWCLIACFDRQESPVQAADRIGSELPHPLGCEVFNAKPFGAV